MTDRQTETAPDTNQTRSRVDRLDVLIAGIVQARLNCLARENHEWLARHSETLRQIERDLLPSGSGMDNGTTIDLDRSTADRLVFNTAFHHMHESGMYDGWTSHTVTVRPSFIGDRDIAISGRDRNGIKEYLAETFDHVLGLDVRQTYDPATDETTFAVVREAAANV